MAWLLGITAAAVLCVLVIALVWRPLRRLGGDIQAERACELFMLQRERIEAQFLPAAAATGKPRGLRWVECAFESAVVEFARDRESRQLVALAPVTIRFEAVPGSDMEGLPAVGNLRNASAVFFFQSGHWLTRGKAVFNMNPAEAVQHFKQQYEPINCDEGSTKGNGRP
jgi:hypothetical protein